MKPEPFNLKLYLDQQRSIVNQGLQTILSGFDPDRELIQAMTHSLMAGGKRLRPILCLSAARSAGDDPLKGLPAACALEFIHTYSLIHDDLPAMDDDDLRRGVPTCHKQFTESTAILAGDALLTHAFFVLSHPQLYFDQYPSHDRLLEIIRIISDASGINGMIEGQMQDVHGNAAVMPDQPDPDENQLLDRLKQVHHLKTGRLIQASVHSGAVSVGAESTLIASLDAYARDIGLAFQVTDDILNVEGDPEIMGKAVGSDSRLDKATFPSLIGLDASKRYAQELIASALDVLSGFDSTAEPLRQIALYIINRNH